MAIKQPRPSKLTLLSPASPKKVANKGYPSFPYNSRWCWPSTLLSSNISQASNRCLSSPSGSLNRHNRRNLSNEILRAPRCSQQLQRITAKHSKWAPVTLIKLRNNSRWRRHPQRRPSNIITQTRTRASARTSLGRWHTPAGVRAAPRALIASSPSMTMTRKRSELKASDWAVEAPTLLTQCSPYTMCP